MKVGGILCLDYKSEGFRNSCQCARGDRRLSCDCGGGIDNFSMTPEPLQIVVRPRGFGEDVDNEVAVVHEYPFCGFIAFDAGSQLAHRFQLLLNFIADRMALPRIGNRADEKEIGERGDLAEVENSYVQRLLRFGCFGCGEPIRQLGGGRGWTGFCGTTWQTVRNVLLRPGYYTGDRCVNAQKEQLQRSFLACSHA